MHRMGYSYERVRPSVCRGVQGRAMKLGSYTESHTEIPVVEADLLSSIHNVRLVIKSTSFDLHQSYDD